MQEKWQCSGSRVLCTASLVDAYSAMANAAEEHWGVASAHLLYAALLEKVLAEVARQHIIRLEMLAQVWSLGCDRFPSSTCQCLR